MNARLKWFFVLILLASAFAGICFRLEIFDAIYINGWITRDIDRAFNLVDGNYFPLVGSEANNGGRLPGPFLYLVYSIALMIHYSYESIFSLNLVLNLVSVIILYVPLRRFFDFNFSALTIAFLCINLTHIGSVGFPINPAFIFPVISIYIWVLLEFGLNENFKILPAIFVLVSLGIQMHFSLLTFYVVPVVIAILFKFKIPKKIILTSIVATLACFIPYFIYLHQNLKVKFTQSYVFFFGPDLWDLSGWLKMFLVENTINRMTFLNGLKWGQHFETEIAILYYGLTLLGLVLLGVRVFMSWRNEEMKKSKKEVILFSLFYVPAFLYELTQPMAGTENPHNWYTFIFIMPQSLILSYFLLYLLDKSKSAGGKGVVLLSISILFLFFGQNALKDVKSSASYYKKNLTSGKYDNLKVFFNSLIDEFNITPRIYRERVFMEGLFGNVPPRSTKLFELIYKESKGKVSESGKDVDSVCYLLFNQEMVKKLGTWEEYRFQAFLEDKDIEIQNVFTLSFADKRLEGSLSVMEYTPKLRQSCFNNTINQFRVWNELRYLYIDGKHLRTDKEFDIEVKSKSEQYNSTSELVSFNGEYLIYDDFLKAPFKFKLSMEERKGRWWVRGDFIGYEEFSLIPPKRVGEIRVTVCPTGLDYNCYYNATILPRKTLATKAHAHNRIWYRELDFPLAEGKLTKGEFDVNLWWGDKSTHMHSLVRYSKSYTVNKILLIGKNLELFQKQK